jgi:hypothetical protein
MPLWKGQAEGVSLKERLGDDDCRNLCMWLLRAATTYAVQMPCVALFVYGWMPAAAPMTPSRDPEYGWFVLGNQSLAAPYAMEVSWRNATDGSPDVWTPPPGALRLRPAPVCLPCAQHPMNPNPPRQNGASTVSSRTVLP